jgi:hypothetical protein
MIEVVDGVGMKKCSKCGERKPVGNFYKDNNKKDRLYCLCKDFCSIKALKNLDTLNEWKKIHPENVKKSDREKHIRKKYGITSTEYETMLSTQNGC